MCALQNMHNHERIKIKAILQHILIHQQVYIYNNEKSYHFSILLGYSILFRKLSG